jgi:hypothetical protein
MLAYTRRVLRSEFLRERDDVASAFESKALTWRARRRPPPPTTLSLSPPPPPVVRKRQSKDLFCFQAARFDF